MPIHRPRTPREDVTRRRARVLELHLIGEMTQDAMAEELSVSQATIAKDLSKLGLTKKIRKRGSLLAIREQIPNLLASGMDRTQVAEQLGISHLDGALKVPRKVYAGNIAALKAVTALDLLEKAHWISADEVCRIEIRSAAEEAIIVIRKLLRFI